MSYQQQCLPTSRRRKRPSGTFPNNESRENQKPMDISALATMDASEYLACVRQQADALPDVFVSEKDKCDTFMKGHKYSDAIDGSAAARDYLLSDRLEILPPPSSRHTPDPKHLKESWKESTMCNFSSLRVYLNVCHQELRNIVKERVKVPKSKDVYAWHVFCLGKEGRDEMESKMTETQMSTLSYDATAVEIDLELSQFNIPPEGHEPTTQLMSQFDQIIIRRLLSHHTKYISAGCTMSSQRMKWVYAILARLEKPLHRDEASILTELLRVLCRARASVELNATDEQNDEVVKGINILILLIGVYFEQCTDLDRLFAVRNANIE